MNLNLTNLGMFEGSAVIGAEPSFLSPIRFEEQSQRYHLSGSGINVFNKIDNTTYLYKKMIGDFTLRARVRLSEGSKSNIFRYGLMVREALTPLTRLVSAKVENDGKSFLNIKDSIKKLNFSVTSASKKSEILQLTRQGNTFKLSVTSYGDPFKDIQSSEFFLPEEVYLGLYVTSPQTSTSVTFSEVRLFQTASEKVRGGSHLEILEVATGNSCVVLRSADCLNAPNWTMDGKALIHNRLNSLIYRLDLETNTTSLIETAYADKCNNDHVLSFDGKKLLISHQHPIAKKSVISILPIEGGTPTYITELPQSYLHGISPDGSMITYTAFRDEPSANIYTMPTTGGQENQLTSRHGHVDGSEYSPDGKYIFFNSVKSGSMQIWRMLPDGSEQTQLTDDEFNNWFPHISPDGKWIVILSYGKDVPPGDHPANKHVYLRLMPYSGGAPKVIAYVYGGQGTINVPSWSPDSKKIAFFSYQNI